MYRAIDSISTRSGFRFGSVRQKISEALSIGARRGRLSFFVPLLAMLVFQLGASSAGAQVCNVDVPLGTGGTVSAQTAGPSGYSFVSDDELDIEIAPDLSSVRLENSKLRVVYRAFTASHPEYAIKEFVIKEANEDQAGGVNDFIAAGAGRGPLASATLTVDEVHQKTVRLEWYRWSITNQQVVFDDRIIIDVSIFPNQAFVRFDNIDIQWHTTVADLASPGGTTSGAHIAHGAGEWNRGYVTHNELPYLGSYYNRLAQDGVFDPVDGGSLNYNGHFIAAVYNPANGRGFGRVLPVVDTHIVKLLLGPTTRRGLETAHYPFLNPHPPFTTYLFAIETGADALAIGRMLADSGGMQPRIECGDTLQLTPEPYTDWDFASWTDDFSGSTTSPLVVEVENNLTVGAEFLPSPADYWIDFENSSPGGDPDDWLDTAANNSLLEDDSLFGITEIDGENVFGTTQTSTNLHSHYIGGATAGGIGYELSGRLKMTDANDGIGVTIFSGFPTDASYYRLRRFSDGSFNLSPLGTSVTGETDTGVVPVPNEWYRFRIQAEDTGTRTNLRAMVWKDGFGEPDDWQIDVYDDSPSRRTAGSFGLWTLGNGGKYIDDVAVHVIDALPTDLVLTLSEVGSGTITPTPDQSQYTQGEVVTLQATGSSGQVFAGWSGDLTGFANPEEITMLGDQSVTATFVDPTLHTLVLDVLGQGVVTPNPSMAQYLLGDVVEVTATPDPGWGFEGFGGALTGMENPQFLTITGDLQVEAKFFEFDLLEDFEATPEGGNATDFFDTGSSNSLTEDDSLFSVEVVGGTQALTTTSTGTNIHTHYSGMQLDGLTSYEFTGRMRLSDLDGGIGVTFFSQMPGSLSYYRLRSYQGGSFHLAPVGAGLSGILDTGVMPTADGWYAFKIQVESRATATDVRVKVWSEADAEPADWQAEAVDSSLTRLTSGTVGAWSLGAGSKHWDDFMIRPIPVAPPSLNLGVTIVGAGGVTLTPNQTLYSPGDTVTLEAIPDPGHYFLGWSGAQAGSDSMIDVVVQDDVAIEATFLAIEPHPLTLEVFGNGSDSIQVTPDQATYLTGETVTLTAVPGAGRVFDGWGADVRSMTSPVQVTILGPTHVTAAFRVPDYANDFEALALGADPGDWFDTGANNTLVESPGLYNVRDLGGQNAFGTDSELVNTHSHWLGSGAEDLADYRYSGRFRMNNPSGGMGVTALSQFPNEVAYYRLRRYQGTTLHLAPVGTSFTSGATDTGVFPAAGVWYRFLLEVEDTGAETKVRAKVWQEGSPEPSYFQAEGVDASASRLTKGTFGVWALGPDSKDFDDLTIVVPEPSGVTMLIFGVAALAVARSRCVRASAAPRAM